MHRKRMPLDEQGVRGVPERLRRHNECAVTEYAMSAWLCRLPWLILRS